MGGGGGGKWVFAVLDRRMYDYIAVEIIALLCHLITW